MFLSDAAFDSIEIYKYLLQETSFEKAYIPLKNKIKIEGVDYSVNEEEISCCLNDPSLLMKREGSKSHLRRGIPTMKFVCPKMKWKYDKSTVYTDQIEHTARRFSAWLPPIQCTLSGHQCMMIIQG